MLLIEDQQKVLICGLGGGEESIVEIVLEFSEGFLDTCRLRRGLIWEHVDGVVSDVHNIVEVVEDIEVNLFLIIDGVDWCELDLSVIRGDREDVRVS